MDTPSFKRYFGYIRCSTDEQAQSGNGLEAQKHAIITEIASRHDSKLVWIAEDAGFSGSKADNRPALQELLKRLRAKEADGLIVAKLDRLSRSVRDFAEIAERAEHQKWQLLILNPRLDTKDIWHKAFLQIASVFAEIERNLISQRTKDGLARVKARGTKLGSSQLVSPDSIQQLAALHASGLSYRQIAKYLNDHNIPSPKGSRWFPATCHKILTRHAATILDR